MDIGESKEAVVSGNHEVADHGEAHAETSHCAVNGSHNRQRKIGQLINDRMHQFYKLPECLLALIVRLSFLLVKHRHVTACHKTRACATQQDTAHRRIVVELQKHICEVRHHLVIQRIQVLRTVEHDLIDRAFLPGKNGVHRPRKYSGTNEPPHPGSHSRG